MYGPSRVRSCIDQLSGSVKRDACMTRVVYVRVSTNYQVQSKGTRVLPESCTFVYSRLSVSVNGPSRVRESGSVKRDACMARVVYVGVSTNYQVQSKGTRVLPESCTFVYSRLVQSKGNRVWPESCTLVYRPTIRFSQNGRVYDPSRVRSCIDQLSGSIKRDVCMARVVYVRVSTNYQVQSKGKRI